MTDYSKMSDFEVNKAVAEITGDSRPKVEEWGISRTIPDYCNNPADAWPIILDNSISVIQHEEYQGQPWFACKGRINATNINPLRAAMIVFLMMKEAGNV